MGYYKVARLDPEAKKTDSEDSNLGMNLGCLRLQNTKVKTIMYYISSTQRNFTLTALKNLIVWYRLEALPIDLSSWPHHLVFVQKAGLMEA